MTRPEYEGPDAIPDSTAPELPLHQRELWALCEQSRPNKCLLDEQTNIQFMGLQIWPQKVPGSFANTAPHCPAQCMLGLQRLQLPMSVPTAVLLGSFQVPIASLRPQPALCAGFWARFHWAHPAIQPGGSGGCEMRKEWAGRPHPGLCSGLNLEGSGRPMTVSSGLLQQEVGS